MPADPRTTVERRSDPELAISRTFNAPARVVFDAWANYDRAFLQVMNLWRASSRVREFVMGQRLGRIAAELLQVQGVRLCHDQSLHK